MMQRHAKRQPRCRGVAPAPAPRGAAPSPPAAQRVAGNRLMAALVERHRLQPKLRVGGPNDRCEQEADRVAELVMRSTELGDAPSVALGAGRLVQPCACGGTCAECADERREDAVLARVAADPPRGPLAPPIVHDVLRRPGEALDAAARAYFEPRFGRDLGHVRIHRGPEASDSARAVGALAYTVGRDIVFAEGRYQPETSAGRRLLAHEVVHTIQQAGPPRGSGVLQRTPGPETSHDCQAIPTTRWIPHIEVDQEYPQHVTWVWNDGATERARCSTGKGHCCVGPEAAQGAACTERGSRQNGSNCTPVGQHTVARRRPNQPGKIPFWTEFVSSRGIALHQYAPVDGTPLSHGCVRLDQEPATRIWCGSREGRTTVRVRGLPRPRCDHGALQQEWSEDFEMAGRHPGDGEPFDATTRREVLETRRELRSALGVGERELGRRVEALRRETHGFPWLPTPSELAAVGRAIPRCVPTETVEEHRLGAPAATPAPGTPRGFVATAGFDRFVAPLERDLGRSNSLGRARRTVRSSGHALWSAALARAATDKDDRPLYWARLAMSQRIREMRPAWLDRLDPDTHRRVLEGLLVLFEQTSRGMDTARFTEPQHVKRIVISGFDPFDLPGEIRTSNPSGAAVLALDGQPLSDGSTSARIQGVIFPVRYPDFDAGVVERFFGPYLRGPHPADLIMTISMGISSDTELEEFAGRRRSSTFPGNLGLRGGGTRTTPIEAPGLGPGAEFLATTVPAATLAAMRASLGRAAALPAETEVIAGAPPRPMSGGAAMSLGLTAVQGTGGGYLSNEIFYRTLRLVRSHAPPVPMIHLHTPQLTVTGAGAGDARFVTARDRFVDAVQHVLLAALPTL